MAHKSRKELKNAIASKAFPRCENAYLRSELRLPEPIETYRTETGTDPAVTMELKISKSVGIV